MIPSRFTRASSDRGTRRRRPQREFDDGEASTTVQVTEEECLSAEGAAVLVDQQDRTLIVRTLDSPAGDVPSGH